MGLKEEFEEYAAKASNSPRNTSYENLLFLYGLYKQATVGDVNTSRSDKLTLRDQLKWDAWNANKGKSKEEAMGAYIKKMKQLLNEAADNPAPVVQTQVAYPN